jgi:hypothetical protein
LVLIGFVWFDWFDFFDEREGNGTALPVAAIVFFGQVTLSV